MTESKSQLAIGLLSQAVDVERPQRTRGNETMLLEVLKSCCELDLLVCAGWTLFSEAELGSVLEGASNMRAVVILETWRDPQGGFGHMGHAVRGNEVLVSRTPQAFATSEQLNGHPELVVSLLDEIERNRQFMVAGRRVTWLMCGELNVLTNEQRDGNRCAFRFADDPVLAARWQNVVDGTDIFVNPTHTVMGNQGKLAKRREYLSAGGRVFCSASNVLWDKDTARVERCLGLKSVQYFYEDGSPRDPVSVTHRDRYILRIFVTW